MVSGHKELAVSPGHTGMAVRTVSWDSAAQAGMGTAYPWPLAWAFPTEGHRMLQATGKDAFCGDDVSVGICGLQHLVPGSGCHRSPQPPGEDR